MLRIALLLTTLATAAGAPVGLRASPFGGPPVLYVDAAARGANDGTSWQDAFTDLQSALAVARDTEVRVASGVYKPTQGTNRAASFVIPSGATVLGGFAEGETDPDERDPDANPTVLSGEIGTPAPGDNSIHVVTTRRTKAVQVLDGFVIRGGFARRGDDIRTLENTGGGLINHGGSPVLQHIRFEANSARIEGGGMYSRSGRPKLLGVHFVGNRTTVGNGAGLNLHFGGAMIADSEFRDNHANGFGGGLFDAAADLSLERVRFIGNSARRGDGGGLNGGGTRLRMTDVVFEGNSARVGGGASLSFERSRVSRVLFRRNEAQRIGGAIETTYRGWFANVTFVDNRTRARSGLGGAVYTTGRLEFINATFARNTAGQGAGAIFTHGGRVLASQSIFWGNSGHTFTEAGSPGSGRVTVVDSVLDGECPRAVTCRGQLIHEDPRLQPLAPNGGYAPSMALGPGSSAIDAGTNARCAAEDQRGIARPVDGDGDGEARCDLGTHEYVPGESEGIQAP